MIKDAIFLVGAERSGTTLLRLMLDHHPQVAFNYEFDYSVELIAEECGFPDLDFYYQWLSTNRIFLSTGFCIDKNLNYRELVNSFLIQKKEQNQKPIVGATVHHHFDKLLSIWPQAKFIHIIRDPRDVAISCVNMGWAGNLWTGPDRWIEAEQTWDKLEKSLSENQYIEIHYEDLIINVTDTLEKLCNFIGVSYDEEMLNYPQNSSYSLPDPSLVFQWKRKLSPQNVQLIETKVGDLLSKKGYSLDINSPIKIDFLQKIQLELEGKLSCLYWRVKRFGLWLLLLYYLARKIGISNWEKRLRLELNRIEEKHLV